MSSCRSLIFALTLVNVPSIAQPIIDIAANKQLFIDTRFVAKSENIELRMNPAQKMGRIQDENGNVFRDHVSRVIDDNGAIKLYIGAESALTVLESTDGMRFKRAGTIPSGILGTVFKDDHDPDPARRYKLFGVQTKSPAQFDPDTEGVYASYSADGLNFTKAGRVLPFFSDNPQVVWWDPRINKYVIYLRAFERDSEN